MFDDGFKQGTHILAWRIIIQRGITVQTRCIDDRKIELRVVRAKLVKQIEGLVDNPIRTGARTVNLIHHHDRIQSQRQRLPGYKPRLRHRPFDRIDQQQNAIDHRQHTLHLPPKSACPGVSTILICTPS